MTNASKPTDKQHKERIPKEALAETDFSPLTVEDLPSKYNFDQAGTLLAWLGTLQILLNLCAVCRGSRSMRSMSTRLDAKEYDIRPRRKSGLTVRMMSNTLIL